MCEGKDAAERDVHGRTRAPASLNQVEASGNEPVVKVYAVQSAPNLQMPWTAKPQEESTGSGFAVLEQQEPCILTNAHVVADATYVEVRKAGDARKYVARRVKVSHECDLATLAVDDETFWQGVTPLSLGDMPCLQDEVSVVGYPEGGEGISITAGVVSRIEIQRYVHSGASLLAIQIDAAINPGNSGGPVLDDDGRVIGVAFQNQQESQNIGYVIPVPTIAHYLADTDPRDASRTSGFCSLGIYWQALENEQLRAYLKMPPKQTGVLVRGVNALAPAAASLRRGDILLEVEGRCVANDGSFAVGQQERLSFQHLIHLKFAGDALRMRLMRDGEQLDVDVPVTPQRSLVPPIVYDTAQPYFIYGGLVFVPLTEPYLQEWGEDWMSDAPHELVELVLSGIQQLADEQPVILSRVFPSRRTAGLTGLSDRRVLACNGESVLNLAQMFSLVQRLHRDETHVLFELQCVGGAALIAVDTATAEEVRDEIMGTYRLPAAASAELIASAKLVD